MDDGKVFENLRIESLGIKIATIRMINGVVTPSSRSPSSLETQTKRQLQDPRIPRAGDAAKGCVHLGSGLIPLGGRSDAAKLRVVEDVVAFKAQLRP